MNITDFTHIKLTNARKAILEVLIDSNKPLSYEDIKDFISMDKATFYRNVAIFEEENLINSFESNDKKRYFEIKKNQHSHFICTNCSKIECIHEKLNLTLPEYKIENIIIKGICKECLKKEKDEK
ncbi:Fur family transcriptional regulator [Aliarcobacter butzleri]|uniref:Transcriptional repressor n=1 Tax=Aliarcobacter butzleri TaxID=28197 RepID=A0AAP4PYH9_9BACT|nr:transcriptional repressor [Aliarcobacter butzleri]MCG3704292.1 transcriptional repressor [Aliarcobacter butzleri]MCT7556499.1 transcriptional repressor [Aliarcobacter butzleri]MCT7576785.1 transcriptional repressor [Aliarcobacter butzleri]MCT7582336.1 transcriptional repressor [Aliarcobacter butzleri]MCT7593029.1 transcriptional repressor [Aliarcobacter butzleri]